MFSVSKEAKTAEIEIIFRQICLGGIDPDLDFNVLNSRGQEKIKKFRIHPWHWIFFIHQSSVIYKINTTRHKNAKLFVKSPKFRLI